MDSKDESGLKLNIKQFSQWFAVPATIHFQIFLLALHEPACGENNEGE